MFIPPFLYETFLLPVLCITSGKLDEMNLYWSCEGFEYSYPLPMFTNV